MKNIMKALTANNVEQKRWLKLFVVTIFVVAVKKNHFLTIYIVCVSTNIL